MAPRYDMRLLPLFASLMLLAACGNGILPAGRAMTEAERQEREVFNEMMRTDGPIERQQSSGNVGERRASVWDMFSGKNTDALGGNVNRHLWNAALDTLNFLPVETVDPFTGVISTGYGTPPGGGRAYRATIYISDAALDARSLKVALQSRGGGPVSAAVVSQVEDAILTRARQLRVRDSQL